MDFLAFTWLSFSLKWLSLSLIANSFKDLNDLGDHPDDDEFDDSSSSAPTDTLSELSDGTIQYDPKVESLKDKKLNRIAEQMLAGLAQVAASKTGDSEPLKVPDPDVSEKEIEGFSGNGWPIESHDGKGTTASWFQEGQPPFATAARVACTCCLDFPVWFFHQIVCNMLCINMYPYIYIYTDTAWICKTSVYMYICFQTKVLETLKTLGDAPKPFPQSAQYKNNSKGESGGGPDPDEAELQAEEPRKPKSKSTRTRRPDVKSAKVKKGDAKAAAASGENTSEPWIYSQIKGEFIKSMVNSGVSKGQAVEAWNQSSQKRIFLSTVSVPELKRRRFIEKRLWSQPLGHLNLFCCWANITTARWSVWCKSSGPKFSLAQKVRSQIEQATLPNVQLGNALMKKDFRSRSSPIFVTRKHAHPVTVLC